MKVEDQAMGCAYNLAREAVTLLDLSQDKMDKGDYSGDESERAEHLLYQMMGVALIFDRGRVRGFVDIYLAIHIMGRTIAWDPTEAAQEAYNQLQDYARELVEDVERVHD